MKKVEYIILCAAIIATLALMTYMFNSFYKSQNKPVKSTNDSILIKHEKRLNSIDSFHIRILKKAV